LRQRVVRSARSSLANTEAADGIVVVMVDEL